MPGLLNSITGPADIKKLSLDKLKELSEEIREMLTDTVSKNGGHLSPNLGVVELTISLHSVFNSPRDKIVWDVGHQSYVHKLLTGRREQFSTLRCFEGMSGFPRKQESPHDVFQTGHASTSISAALGLAKARDLKKKRHHVIAVIGDGALTGGIALEALNHAGHAETDLLVVLNDNEMSISKNVGGMASYLNSLRADPAYSRMKEDVEFLMRRIPAIGDTVYKSLGRIKDSLKYLLVPGMLFEELGFTYLGPVDGHNISLLRQALVSAKKLKGPVLLHVLTKKGKGYHVAEKNPDQFHGIGPFDVKTGKPLKNSTSPSYTEVFSRTLINLAEKDKRIVGITAAMPSGTGLDKFAENFPERFIDVGIAEQHALTFSAGLAAEGFRPVVAIYSSFLQRGYDQIVHDICLQKLPVVIGIDRAGIVGEDGETHQGAFDISFLRHIPGMVVMAPQDERELQNMLYTALHHEGPVALRYPRGSGPGVPVKDEYERLDLGKSQILLSGPDLVIFALGTMVEVAQRAAEGLKEYGIKVTLVNARFVKPLDEHLIINLIQKCKKAITIEENVLQGGFGSGILELLEEKGINGYQLRRLGLPDCYIEHGPRSILLDKYGLNVSSLMEAALEMTEARTLKINPGSR
ncbi:MAG: 1-deoxy-D-xylulose-5-phosphate synthase [Candidatus Syntrophonatronum acetioxidans]|uniref:1-deoxy-D-xylulose-5-phosphate synthase n=1 Tax=Candidatus Syntrophonatronum acetioxidans TaxID=1795816 RepID=A0A424YFA7_9FIRM|nr:MAG: 1-deoxy-D-xylulose-5-phosphate synthase [Candidatus Syntrophonatronum acetioxidans]